MMNAAFLARTGAAIATALLILGCAPDALVESTKAEDWIDALGRRCTGWIDDAKIPALAENNPYFLDLLTRFYFGDVTPEAFRSGIQQFVDASPDGMQTVTCIIAQRRAAPKTPGP
jgi:hypothetical protein